VLTRDLALARFPKDALAVHPQPKSVANWVTNEVLREAKDAPIETLRVGGAQVGSLAALVDGGTLSATLGKEVFGEMIATGRDPQQIVAERGLEQIDDEAHLLPVVDRIIAANADKAAQYRAGKTGLLGFFVGQVMRETQSRANPKLVQTLVQRQLASA